MQNIYDVLRVLVNAARVQVSDSVIGQCHEVIDKLDPGPAAAAPAALEGDASA
jgi:hypothetical protein